MRTWLVVLLVACSGPTKKSGGAIASDCERAVDKLFAMMGRRGFAPPDGQRPVTIEECKQVPNDPSRACILAAPNDDAIEKCLSPAPKGEPHDQLADMIQNVRTYYFIHETFTDQKLALFPAKPCCQFPTKKCPPDASADEWWTAVLKLDVTTERSFQYRFESTSDKATIEAVGDLDCDGKTVTYRRELEQRDDGNLHITVFDPPKDSD